MEHNTQQHIDTSIDSLKFVEYASAPINVIDSDGVRHTFRKFRLLNNWGICNGDYTKIIVEAKPNYANVEVLTYARLLVAGKSDIGWDVYSLTGGLVESLPPMSSQQAAAFLDEQRRNSISK